MATKDPITISSDDWTQVSASGFMMGNETGFEIRYRFDSTKPTESLNLGHEMLQNGNVNSTIIQNCWMKLITKPETTATVVITDF